MGLELRLRVGVRVRANVRFRLGLGTVLHVSIVLPLGRKSYPGV